MAHTTDGSDLFCSNFGFMTFLQLLGQWHILQMGVIFFNFGFMTFLQLLGQWHILQMGVIYGSQGFTQIHSLTVLLYILQANIDFPLNNFYNLGYLRILQANIYFHHFLWIFLQPRLQQKVIYLNVFVLYMNSDSNFVFSLF